VPGSGAVAAVEFAGAPFRYPQFSDSHPKRASHAKSAFSKAIVQKEKRWKTF